MAGGPTRRWCAVLAASLLLLGCTADEEPEAAGTGADLGPEAQPPGAVDPCLLGGDEVAAITDEELPQMGPSGGEIFAICTYGDPEAAGATADIALVDLTRVSEESGQEVDGEAYIAELADGVGTGTAEPLDGLGDGSAVLLSYAFGSQAWAYRGDAVYGAYASGLADDDALAVELLEAVLDSLG